MVASLRLPERLTPTGRTVETPADGAVPRDASQARVADRSASLPRAESFERGAAPGRIGGLPTPSVTAVLPRQPAVLGALTTPVDSRARVSNDTQPAATTGDTVTPEAAEMMTRLRVSLSKDRSRLDLPGSDPVMFFGTAERFEARVDDGRLRIDVNTGGDMQAHMQVDIDPATRAMTVSATVDGETATSNRSLPTDVRDLLQAKDGRLVPAEGVDQQAYRAADVPALRDIFVASQVDLTQTRAYFETDINFGSIGNTVGGFPFINPREARNFSATLPGEGTPDTYATAARNNELSHQLWRDIDSSAMMRHNPAASSQQRSAFMVENLAANDFRTLDTGTTRVPVRNNKQINELVSDAVSINTDARDIYRIVPFLDSSSTGYAVSAGVLRGELTRVFRARGMSEAAITDELRAAVSDTAAATQRWALTDAELSSIQTSYRDIATRAVRTYATAVERRASSG